MIRIKITIICPNCENNIVKVIVDNEATVDVMSFEQTTWECDKCEKTFLIGDIEIVDKDDL